MVTLDPCKRLRAIKEQLIPAILTSARENTTSDIKAAIDINLRDLEKNCYELSDRCKETWPECGEDIELCNKDNIEKIFLDTREHLKTIWEERVREEYESDAETFAKHL